MFCDLALRVPLAASLTAGVCPAVTIRSTQGFAAAGGWLVGLACMSRVIPTVQPGNSVHSWFPPLSFRRRHRPGPTTGASNCFRALVCTPSQLMRFQDWPSFKGFS